MTKNIRRITVSP